MKKVLLVVLLFCSGCSFKFEPYRPVVEQNLTEAQKQQIADAINSLNQFALKADERLKALEPKKVEKK